jgi:hypothetical protein
MAAFARQHLLPFGNYTLKNLVVDGFEFSTDELCPALQDGLGKNLTLERLELYNLTMAEADATALSFYFAVIKAVQPNKTMKTLYLCY